MTHRATETKAKAKAHATKATASRRVEEVARLRLRGAAFWNLREHVRGKEAEEGGAWHLAPGVKPMSDGQLWRYVKKADQLLSRSADRSRRQLLRMHLAQLGHLHYKAMQSADYRTALACLESEAELLGLYPKHATGPRGRPFAKKVKTHPSDHAKQ